MFKKFRDTGIGLKIAGFFIIMSFISIASYFIINNFLSEQETDAHIINVAGKERMLIQKLSKDALLMVSGTDSSKGLLETANLFENSLEGLIAGSKELGLPPMPSEAVTTQLRTVKEYWQPFKESVVSIANQTGNSDQALAYIIENNMNLLSEMNEAVGMYESYSNEKVSELKGQLLISNGIIIILSIIGWLLFNHYLVTPLKKMVGVAEKVSSGDLTGVEMKVNSNDEIGKLTFAMNKMQSSLKRVIQNVYVASESVSSQSEELTQSANEVRTGSEQVASTMQELSSGAESQAATSINLEKMMEEFGLKIQQTNQNGEAITEISQNVLSMTEEGRQLMKISVAQMKTIDEIVNDSVVKVRGLDEQSQEISKLIQVIQDIAEQTNLLSLNAAIEAARAGEQGKGFAVVANEVRKLAEKVSESVIDITGIVTNIQSESSKVVQSLETGYKEVDEGSKQIAVTGNTFEKIDLAVSDMVAKIQNISANLKDIAENSNRMNKSAQDIASVSEESAAGIEQTTASVQQSSSSMDEVSRSADELSELAEQLTDQVRQFKL